MKRLARLLPLAVCPVPGRRPAREDELPTQIPVGDRLLGLVVITVLVAALLA